jgi:SAM-dependent methyltransferase
MKSDMNSETTKILSFWKNNSKLTNIYPPRNKIIGEYCELPEVFNILTDLTKDQTVLEFGCGYGRLAHLFEDNLYIGVDINKYAIDKAKLNHPNKKFILIDDTFILPQVEVIFAYSVFFHIPINYLIKIIEKISISNSKLIIAEIMDGKSKPNKMPPLIFRGVEKYIEICKIYGFNHHKIITTQYEKQNPKKITTFLELSK